MELSPGLAQPLLLCCCGRTTGDWKFTKQWHVTDRHSRRFEASLVHVVSFKLAEALKPDCLKNPKTNKQTNKQTKNQNEEERKGRRRRSRERHTSHKSGV